MALPKICGIETEYGILIRGAADFNPISASSLLVNSFVNLQNRSVEHGTNPNPRRVGWDFDDESPATDARGDALYLTYAPEVETHLVNAVLTNGSRYYVDHAHPELSTPECRTALQALLYDRAGEEIMIDSMTEAQRTLAPPAEILVYKNNSDGKGQSYGCHENYLLARSLTFGSIVTAATTHFVTRQIFTGSGKVGSEAPGMRTDEVPYQLTQRADFFEEEVGLETTLKRPIVNTRDEPHADPQIYRRLHVIAGDANMSEVATFAKLGTTGLLFAALEDGALGEPIVLADPVRAMHTVSRDMSLAVPLTLVGGRRATALDIQWELLARCRDYVDADGGEAVGVDEAPRILAVWEQLLAGLEADPMSCHRTIDWVAKYRVLEAYRERHGLGWDDARLAAMDLQYHDLRPDRSLARRIGLDTLVDAADVREAKVIPPPDTRAFFRGTCLARFPDAIVAANWDSMVFDTGAASLRRVPMMDPTRGTRDHVGALLDAADNASDLLDALSR